MGRFRLRKWGPATNAHYRLILVGLLAAVFAVGLAASYLVHHAANEAIRGSRMLLQETYADSRALERFKTDLLLHERQAYHAYGAIRPDALRDRQAELARRIEQRWSKLGDWGLDADQRTYLISHWRALRAQTRKLYRNLSAADTDWDDARAQLAALHQRRLSMEPLLDHFGRMLEQQAKDGTTRNLANLQYMSRLVAVYTGVIFLIAAAVAGVLWRLARISRTNKALAELPNRNPNPVLTLDGAGVVTYANPGAMAFARRISEGTQSAIDLLPSDLLDAITQSSRGTRDAEVGEHVLQYEWEWLADLGRYHVYIVDVTERRQAEDRLRHLAYEDAITGLPNREGLLEVIRVRLGGYEPSVLTVRLERFDTLLAQHGFQAADELLANAAEALQEAAVAALGKDTVVGRLDGPLFGVVAPPSVSYAMVEKLLERLPREIQTACHRFQTGYRIGVRLPEDEEEGNGASARLKEANAALLAAERSDTTRIVLHDLALETAEAERARVEAYLRDALRTERGLQAYLQPKLDLASRKVVGAELLARWEDPELGRVSPGQFIPVAEQSGLILELGEWVLERAMRILREWQTDPEMAHARLAINVAAPELRQPEWASQVLQRMTAFGVPGSRLEVEVTERIVAGSEDWATVTNLRRLRSAGVHVSIDDFGTGYSSLAYIHRLPINGVKIDKQFVDSLPADNGERPLARVIVEMAEGLGLETVAEGVENEAQEETLAAMGCHQVQGFLFARPMPPGEFSHYLKTRNAERVRSLENGEGPHEGA